MLQSELVKENVGCEPKLSFASKYLVPGKMEPRAYQLDIVRRILRKNYLVVLPTGLGKTPIAIMVTARTLEDYPDDFKVIVLAPTKPLITQHARSFKEFLTIDIPEDQVVLTGNIAAEKRKKIFASQRILFYTPETLRNDILTDSADGKQPLYDLKKVALIIFDEAHHASGNYAYCPIAKLYREMNPDGNILGLTASPGSNDTKVETLCENLFIPVANIEMKVRTDDDVKDYVNKMTILKVGVQMNSFMAEILGELKNLLNTKLLQFINSGALNLVDVDPNGFDINHASYKQILGWQKQLTDVIKNGRSKGVGEVDKRVYTAISLAAEIARVYYMVNSVERQGLNVLAEYLSNLQKEAQKTNASKSVVNLFYSPLIKKIVFRLNESYNLDSKSLIHPKLFKLMLFLREEVAKNPDLRTLIFTELRDSVINITKHLSKYPEIKPIKFVGQATRNSDDKGLSQKKQIEILDEFRKGTYNVLVSTSVAEEGLDIAECDLVIFYDAVPSEIRLIQRRGRTARKHEGKVILMYCIGTSDERYLNMSMSKLKAMQKNLSKPELNRMAREQSSAKEQSFPKERLSLKEVISPKEQSTPKEDKPRESHKEQATLAMTLQEGENTVGEEDPDSEEPIITVNNIAKQSLESQIENQASLPSKPIKKPQEEPHDMTTMDQEIKKSTNEFFDALKNVKIRSLSLDDGEMEANAEQQIDQVKQEPRKQMIEKIQKEKPTSEIKQSETSLVKHLDTQSLKQSNNQSAKLSDNQSVKHPSKPKPVKATESEAMSQLRDEKILPTKQPVCESIEVPNKQVDPKKDSTIRIFLRRDVPVIYGLRKNLSMPGSVMDYRDTLDPKDIFGCFKPDLVISDQFAMKVFKLHEFERVYSLFIGDATVNHTITKDFAQITKAFGTILLFVDFLSYDPLVHGNRQGIIGKIEKLGQGLNVMALPIDSGEEITTIVSTIISKIIAKNGTQR
jgi:ERCC4-related helicase